MPSSTSGLSGDEIISYVQNFIGNNDSTFRTFLTTLLPLAELRYCKVHDWSFLQKINLPLTVASGTMEYTLDSSTIGYFMPSQNVKSVFSQTYGIYLRKTTLDQIRRMDPDENDGSTGQKLLYWAPSGDNKIVVYPPTFQDTQLRVDGTIVPSALLTTSNYPTIPFRFQEAFIQYVLAVALMRENDSRSQEAKQDAALAIRMDIQNDLAGLGNTTDPRIRSLSEQRQDGIGPTTDPLNMLWDPFA